MQHTSKRASTLGTWSRAQQRQPKCAPHYLTFKQEVQAAIAVHQGRHSSSSRRHRTRTWPSSPKPTVSPTPTSMRGSSPRHPGNRSVSSMYCWQGEEGTAGCRCLFLSVPTSHASCSLQADADPARSRHPPPPAYCTCPSSAQATPSSSSAASVTRHPPLLIAAAGSRARRRGRLAGWWR